MPEKPIAAKSPAKNKSDYSRNKRFMWKAFFVLMALGYLFLVPGVFFNALSTLDFVISLPAIAALYGFVWAKRFGPANFWKAYFSFFLIWEVFIAIIVPWLMPNLVLYGETSAEEASALSLVIVPVTLFALFTALWRYAKGTTLPPPHDADQKKWYRYKFALTAREIKEQVDGYDKFKFRRTARGQAVICITAIIVISALFAAVGGATLLDTSNTQFWVGPVMYGLVGLFIYLEKRWAGPAALILLTFDKLSAIFFFGEAAIFTATLTWLIFAPYFYRVFQVETVRQMKKA